MAARRMAAERNTSAGSLPLNRLGLYESHDPAGALVLAAALAAAALALSPLLPRVE